MDLSREELKEVMFVVKYYLHHHISIKSPRFTEYEVILQKLTQSIQES